MLNDLFPIIDDIDLASYANDNTIYYADDSIDDVILSLQDSAKKVFQSFSDNQMKGNSDQNHLLLSNNDERSDTHMTYIFSIKEDWICAVTRHLTNNIIDKKSSF